MRVSSTCALFLVVATALGIAPARAQQSTPQRQQVISANPLGLMLELSNAEYERKVSESATFGVGGSQYKSGSYSYLNYDAFYRFYAAGKPLQGMAYGVKAGLTKGTKEGSYLGVGFDVNRSWILGMDERLYVGLGFGLKRLFAMGGATRLDGTFLPTIRIVNIGFAF